MSQIARAALTGSALAVAALLAAGCSSSSSIPPTTSSAGTSSSSSSATGASGTPASGGPATSTASPGSSGSSLSAATSSCATTHLHATNAGGNGAAGSVYVTIDLTNTGSTSCELYGYPGVSLLDSSSARIGAAAARKSELHAPTLVTLAPGAEGNFVVQIAQAANYPSSTCDPKQAAYLNVFPPNQTQAIELPTTSTGCASDSVELLYVGAVAAGAGSTN
jgi:hypothetical protein